MPQRPQRLWARLASHPWFWLAPIFIPFVLFLLIPVVRVVWLSFHHWDWGGLEWSGLGQYRRLLRDPEFWRALFHTLLFAAVVVPGWILLTLIIASIIAPRRPQFRSFWMTVFYMTYLISPVVLAIVWSWMLAPGADGLI